MFNYTELIIALLISLLASLVLTYPVKKFAIWFGALDVPNHRKIHKNITPRMGGLAIFLGAFAGALYLQPKHDHILPIFLGAIVIILTGVIDDRYDIRPVIKLSGQLIAASFLISSGLIIERVTLPVFGVVELGFVSVLITALWVVGITNAINLIDGLDGLATGVSTIALSSMLVMAIIDLRIVAVYLCVVLIGANLGFLFHNFYPAKIYMGDTGSNFLGYMIAAISMLGLFKNVAIFSFIIPVIILAVPILDTMLAIIRRLMNKEGIMNADNKHIHYRLLENGLSHRTTVLIVYAFSIVFGAMAILFSYASYTMTFFITLLVFIFIHLLAELSGIVLGGKRPIIDFVLRLFRRQKGQMK